MRILHLIYGLNIGGAESFIRNEMEAMSIAQKGKTDQAAKAGFEFDFAIQNPNITNTALANMAGADHIHMLPAFPRHVLSQSKALTRLLREGSYDVVHIHANALVNPVPIDVCKHLSQPAVIHSHSTENGGGI